MTSKDFEFYPIYTYSASSTFNEWVKISCADIEKLSDERGRDGIKHLFFYLNHPIRFVTVVAPIVAIDDINGKYVILILDDGSGATVSVKIKRRSITHAKNVEEHASNTLLDSVNVYSGPGKLDIKVGNTELDIGTVVKTKCTITKFRQANQLEAQRIWIVQSTKEEARAWSELTIWKNKISTPWLLSKRKLLKLEQEHKAEYQQLQEENDIYEKKMSIRKRRKAKQEANDEAKRLKLEKKMNQGALI
ncbi:hypothetical protein BT63DRAFT_450077 [Microthyrium microscopicum]|uniref:CST complex subunit Stn1 N-terminal domain-containing protein n=1 Tax=Microthyrium microscopicum TaxID=703497 RepID=A0A6A6UUI1_9PEZI|nr:hypothetical protein BT63DRAFT_450077 [Microthyrium microscopicum]